MQTTQTHKHTHTHTHTHTHKVGKSISTKAVGTKKREDITNRYKYKEGTLAERAALGAKGSGKVGEGGSQGEGYTQCVSLLLGWKIGIW